MLLRPFLLACASLVVAALAGMRPVVAQSLDVIRGRVTSAADSLPIENVRITVTSISGSVSRTARTDRNGRFMVTFPDGDGDYIVAYAGIGYAARQLQVRRTADQAFLVADIRLRPVAQGVEAVEVIARDRVNRNDNQGDVGATDRAVTNDAVPSGLAGDLAAAAATVPGITFIPGEDGDPNSFSVLGLSSDQNNATLNGIDFSAANVPRDAPITTSLVTQSYDVSRGGFSGAQTVIRTRSGTNIRVRGSSLTIDSPSLQWTDRAAQALGAEYSNLSLGGVVSGPIAWNKAFYNISAQIGRRANDLETFLNAGPAGLEAAGIAPDSATRLLGLLQTKGIPAVTGALDRSRVGDQGSILGALDFNPPTSASGAAYNISFNANWGTQKPVSGAVSELPAHSGDRNNWSGGIQARQSGYYSVLLSETSASVSVSSTAAHPYLSLPSGRVRVTSALSDGTSGVQSLSFGGSPSLSTSQRTTTALFVNSLSWFSLDNQHRLKLTTELRYDKSAQRQATNTLGSFAFNSLSDFEQDIPSSFTRQLASRERDTRQLVGGLSLGDSYRRNDAFQMQYGLRIDGNSFLTTPERNPAVDSAFGVRNDGVPNRLYLSPRVGFTWTYGLDAQIASFAGAVRPPAAVLRGGLGVFQNAPSVNLLGSALDNTGLAGAIQQLNCVGAAAPAPDWNAYILDPAAIPDQCADSTAGTVFSNDAPAVSLFAKRYVAPRSVRANLAWSGPAAGNRFALQAEATYSVNLNQSSSVDLNFNPTARFTLADEGDRPIFVEPTSIVPATGAIASRDARVSQAFSRVTEGRSDLRSESAQLSLRVAPVVTTVSGFRWSLSYVFSDVREQVRGFTSTTGNPLDVEWARSSLTSRHQISYGLSYPMFGLFSVAWNGSFRSGTPFTPMVGGDANGDGYGNDRAFVFDPSLTPDLALATGMEALLDGGSHAARECLAKQINTLARRNSCQGPWTSSAAMTFTFDPVKFRMPHRATLSLALSNPLGAADLLMHGSDDLRGWGQSANLDQSLLYIRGFDQGAERYRYEVNQRFGTKSAALAGFRTPVTLTMLLRFDLGPTRERQSLLQQLNQGRTLPGNRNGEAFFRQVNGSGTVANPLPAILRAADTLKLTKVQADSLTNLARWFATRVDSIWAPVNNYLGGLPEQYDAGEAYDRYSEARAAWVDLLIALTPQINGLLTPAQRRQLPPAVASYLDPRYLAAIRPGTGSYLGPLAGRVIP